MQFEEELARVLPLDVPHRERLISLAVQHLQRIVAANEHMNLTRIVSPREAAVKHVYDCVAPWRHFQDAKRVLDAGTGAGFPGVPLAIVLPEVRFTLAESIGKKARFVESAVEALGLPNAEVSGERAEEFSALHRIDVITARAVAPIPRLIDLFARPLKAGVRLLLFKGPDVSVELAEAKMHRMEAKVLCQYELPDGYGSRTLIELRLKSVERERRRTPAKANQQ